jgi:prepilin-type N-terminal cleavage/methylation domain-containing protein
MGGFTLLEVIFAIAIFAVGILGLALLMTVATKGTTHSRYMNMAAAMANEKLEDLNRVSLSDPAVTLPTGSTSVGDLTKDVTATPVSGDGQIYYFDNVQSSAANGSVTEIRNGVDQNGADCLEIFQYTPTNSTPVSDSCTSTTAPSASGDTIVFHRRWMIESPVSINGVSVTGARRITVQVTLSTETAGPAVTFQMSTIRS